jgi:hypothetical protein
MFGVRFEIGQFDHHSVRCAWAIGADLDTDQPPGPAKGGTADRSKLVYGLLEVAIEDRSQIWWFSLICDDGLVGQNTDRECYPETKNPHVSPRI